MTKSFLTLSLACIIAALMTFHISNAGSNKISANIHKVTSIIVTDSADAEKIKRSSAEVVSSLLYDSLKLNKLGLSKEALLHGYTGYCSLADKGVLSNNNILTICDFSQSSRKKRLYVIDVINYKVLMNTYVAHGKNSGLDYATEFSNTPESLQSSLGFYVTKNTYLGKHGLSLKLGGLENGWNSNAEARAVVIHGAAYIGDHRIGAAYMGRSWGCPAVPEKEITQLINIIKNGSCLFIYHPSDNYLHGSKVLNG